MYFLVFEIVANLIALVITSSIVPGFDFVGLEKADEASLISLLISAIILTLLNLFIRPLLKLFLFPVILLTFGFASILVNLLILSFLDYLSDPLSISSFWGLVWSALIIGWVNTLIHQFKPKL
jgi:putative membrane protein